MTNTALALLAYISLTLVLVVTIVSHRSLLVLRGRPANQFVPDGTDVSAFSQRLSRAYANCIESSVVMAGLLLLALAVEKTVITDALAPVLIGARVAQTATHLISTSSAMVTLRFAFFLVQLAIAAYWLWQFLRLGIG